MFSEFGGDAQEGLADNGGRLDGLCFALIVFITPAKYFLHEAEVFIRCYMYWGVAPLVPVFGDYSPEDLAAEAEEVLFIIGFTEAQAEDGLLYDVFGLHAVLCLGERGFYEHAAELSEGFWVVNHFGGSLNDVGKGALGVGGYLFGILGVFVALSPFSPCAEVFRLHVAEVQVDSEPFCYLVGLDAPECGQRGHAVVKVRTRDHIGTKVRSF